MILSQMMNGAGRALITWVAVVYYGLCEDAVSDGEITQSAMKIPGDGNARFRLPIYEGPLDLLLHLIKKAELDPA